MELPGAEQGLGPQPSVIPLLKDQCATHRISPRELIFCHEPGLCAPTFAHQGLGPACLAFFLAAVPFSLGFLEARPSCLLNAYCVDRCAPAHGDTALNGTSTLPGGDR